MRMCNTISRDPGIRQVVSLQHLRGSNSISLKVRFLFFPPTSTGVEHSLDEVQKPRLEFLLTLFSYPEIVLYLQNLRHKLTSGACFPLIGGKLRDNIVKVAVKVTSCRLQAKFHMRLLCFEN